MTVSIITLKTGERIITELKEAYEGTGEDKKGICLIMEEPYVLNLEGEQPQYLTEQHGMEYQIRFSKWNPYSLDTHVKIPYDCVMTISNPEPGLENAYVNKINEKKKKYDGPTDTTTTED